MPFESPPVPTSRPGPTSPPAAATPATRPPLLVLREVRHVYEDDGVSVEALSGVTLSVFPGELVALVGESGSGKSTLLHLMGAMDRPTAGEVILRGRDLGPLDEEARAAVRRREIGFVFQFFNLLPTLDLLENVMLPALIAGRDPVEARARAESLLRTVGLGGLEARRVSHLAGGERQRGAIARALVNEPPLVLADEPTGNLDRRAGGEIVRLLRALPSAHGTAVVLATHSAVLAEAADRVITLSDGVIVG